MNIEFRKISILSPSDKDYSEETFEKYNGVWVWRSHLSKWNGLDSESLNAICKELDALEKEDVA
jgi:hypothetical protein